MSPSYIPTAALCVLVVGSLVVVVEAVRHSNSTFVFPFFGSSLSSRSFSSPIPYTAAVSYSTVDYTVYRLLLLLLRLLLHYSFPVGVTYHYGGAWHTRVVLMMLTWSFLPFINPRLIPHRLFLRKTTLLVVYFLAFFFFLLLLLWLLIRTLLFAASGDEDTLCHRAPFFCSTFESLQFQSYVYIFQSSLRQTTSFSFSPFFFLNNGSSVYSII